MAQRRKTIQAVFYQASSGRQPVREWLLELNDADRRAIGKDIQRLEFEWPVGMPVCRSLSDDLWEIRSTLSQGRIARVLFAIDEGELFLLHGFIKKSRKTPLREIELARKRLQKGKE
jgi:phage-related protein